MSSKITFKAGDLVRCVKTSGANSKLVLGATYIVKEDQRGFGSYVRLQGLIGSFFPSRFELVETPKAMPKATPFGQVKAVTVNKADVHQMLTFYVQFTLGINATVEKIVDKFPEAVELVLSNEAAA